MNEGKKRIPLSRYVILHILFVMYSMISVISKTIGDAEFFSKEFIIGYGLIFLILAVYAIAWQQMLKVFTLSEAFANKAAVVIWGIVWGTLFFKEDITLTKMIGSAIIVIGIYLFATEEKENEKI